MSEAGLSSPTSAKGRLQRAALALLREHEVKNELPTSNRFLFYELVQQGVLDKAKTRAKGRGADQDLSDATKWLRDIGLVPWDWIVDETRSVTSWRYADTVAEFVSDSVDSARIDLWDGEPPPLIICESRTFGGVLARGLAPKYLCPVTATNGQVGGFLHTDVVPVLEDNERTVLYIGDLDVRGSMIEANTQHVLVHAGERPWVRVALTQEQADEHELPAIEKYDKVLRAAYPAIEVESLGQSTVTGIIEDALEELLPEAFDIVDERLHSQRDAVREVLGGIDFGEDA